MPPMDLASARGTKLSDIVINHRPSTGRGKRLTIPQEGVLRRLYEQELPSLSNGELPARGFWENLASQFHKRTGREYSWLSVKRRAAGWGQKSVETDRRLDTSRASELEIENSVSEPSDHEIPHDPPPQEGSYNSEQPTLSQTKPSPHSRYSNIPELSQLERSPGVGDWLQRSWVSGRPDPSQNTSGNLRSHRLSKPRPRSRSPQGVSQPGYRRRSPSPKRRTKITSKRLQDQLSSSSNVIAAPGPNHLSGYSPAYEYVRPSHLGRRNFPRFNHIRETTEKDEPENPENHPRDSERAKTRENYVRNGLLVSPHLSDEDDLPLAPTRIMRRRVAK
ncbi:uncharacterized protein N7487_008233 [Penicillium crustosum]|uniref:uncharacterized protein n=1 Tax=Penicillium crustosum TaxID=36656 RepID=UPI002393B4D0|nr:uncharacterized protein N7487_008233 [Penicillium crustosum]KAJ5402337.1 hypothetical protein N7487_008233 [Penicillium crustosum]